MYKGLVGVFGKAVMFSYILCRIVSPSGRAPRLIERGRRDREECAAQSLEAMCFWQADSLDPPLPR